MIRPALIIIGCINFFICWPHDTIICDENSTKSLLLHFSPSGRLNETTCPLRHDAHLIPTLCPGLRTSSAGLQLWQTVVPFALCHCQRQPIVFILVRFVCLLSNIKCQLPLCDRRTISLEGHGQAGQSPGPLGSVGVGWMEQPPAGLSGQDRTWTQA